ncbi:carbonic anhydrase 7-like [Daktulosphaira vitifoliae]|uniref:carbonic anhydrase 7-like n=1 Tax=Daktulosphaira vitifoliae TaxID=58002 RepID=UPI0021A9B09A|nr:carbonic anhydrase 7-like [Daktulosphaira vitifoliae]XP_050526093.1 carbonic anhydrase 7-like [Daktulosphaira vitifoliae]
MIWEVFALWLTSVVSTTLQSQNVETDSTSIVVPDGWPYVINEYNMSEQSPVDISTKHAVRRFLPFLRTTGYWTLENSQVEIKNTGHTVRVQLANTSDEIPYVSGGPLFDAKYEFVQLHFHWGKDDFGSEHKVNGHQYAMEVHIVHYKKKYGSYENAQNFIDGICVIGFFGQVTTQNNLEMTNFVDDLKFIENMNTSIIRPFKEEFSWIKDTALKQHYYTYHGSLTTPPYAECVIWIIFTKPIPISRAQLKKFRNLHSSKNGILINENDRPLQPFNDRPIVYGY